MCVEQPTSSQLDNSGRWGSTREGLVHTVNMHVIEKERETLEMFRVTEPNQKSLFFLSRVQRALSEKERCEKRLGKEYGAREPDWESEKERGTHIIRSPTVAVPLLCPCD